MKVDGSNFQKVSPQKNIVINKSKQKLIFSNNSRNLIRSNKFIKHSGSIKRNNEFKEIYGIKK